jgi:hypothetical protein
MQKNRYDAPLAFVVQQYIKIFRGWRETASLRAVMVTDLIARTEYLAHHANKA